ncbi:MAG: T9SS type A sorting domain-containing protein [Bacteroidales bacterium]|nr:T9SS type A sorting domain-containing protein [Bacteroidales bacterium]MDY0216161.1 T9SS type A sorting domain-containing protein [Bacteroidales bacterium]
MTTRNHFLFIFISFFVLTPALKSQDTIRLMHYNLMQYSMNPFGGCTIANNNLDKKDSLLKVILNHANPDVITVNEITNTQAHVDRIRNNVLNTNGVNYWKSGQLTSLSGGTLANMIYYDSRKLTMHSHYIVQTTVRDINIYRMYFNTPDLVNGDTIFFIPIVAHLKAGSTETDGRLSMIQQLMSRLNNWGISDNYVLSGDFNIYTSTEPAYQHLLNYPNSAIRFYDPIDTPGNWNNSYSYRHVHTQSTHTSGECFATGGMDDRFDFILVSAQILNGYDNVKALSETYKAFGQDGNRFNGSMISPANTVVPQNIANALYGMSDHLPVMMDFLVYYPQAGINSANNLLNISTVNPFSNEIVLKIQNPENENFNYSISNIEGKTLKQGKLYPLDQISGFKIETTELQRGIYILKVYSKNQSATLKLIKITLD